MHDILRQLTYGVDLMGEVARDVQVFLAHHGRQDTAAHCAAVAAEARRVAEFVGADAGAAEQAGWLHDVSVVFPSAERAEVAKQLDIDVLPEEDAYPMIVHQKLSAALGREIFGVGDSAVLSAVGCHTTLKAGATTLDKVVFVADKLAWDQPGTAPFQSEMLAALGHSLDHTALVYLRYLWEQRETLRVFHPWARQAYIDLSGGSAS